MCTNAIDIAIIIIIISNIIALSFIKSFILNFCYSVDFTDIITGSARKTFILTIPSCSCRAETFALGRDSTCEHTVAHVNLSVLSFAL